MRMAAGAPVDCRESGSARGHACWSVLPRKPAPSVSLVTQDGWADLTGKRRPFESLADGRGDFICPLPSSLGATSLILLWWWRGGSGQTRRTSARCPWWLVRLPPPAGAQRLGGNQRNRPLPSPNSRLPPDSHGTDLGTSAPEGGEDGRCRFGCAVGSLPCEWRAEPWSPAALSFTL